MYDLITKHKHRQINVGNMNFARESILLYFIKCKLVLEIPQFTHVPHVDCIQTHLLLSVKQLNRKKVCHRYVFIM